MRTEHRAAILAVLTAITVGGWMYLGPPSEPDQKLPPADATVATVAASYLDAAVRQDCPFTDALTLARTFSWCTSPTMTAYRNLEGPVSFTKEQAGRDEQCVSFEMTTTESSDGSIAAGDGPWSLCFVSAQDAVGRAVARGC